MKHPDCGGEFTRVRTPLERFLIDGLQCSKCEEVFHDPEHTQLVAAYNKLKGREFEATVTTTGNSVAFRIDKELVREYGLDRGDKLQVRAESPTELVISVSEPIETLREARTERDRILHTLGDVSNSPRKDIMKVENLPNQAVNEPISP